MGGGTESVGGRGRPGGAVALPWTLGALQGPGKAAIGWGLRLHASLCVHGADRVPRRGPVILAANHQSMLDVPLLVVACPRPVTFMANVGIFRGPAWSTLFHLLGGFPVDSASGSDRRALEVGTAILESGRTLGIYPEGTRSRTGAMLAFQAGAAWLSLRTGAPIVPVGIRGTLAVRRFGEPLWIAGMCPRRASISFGAPMLPGREPDARRRRGRIPEVTAELRRAIAALAGLDPGTG